MMIRVSNLEMFKRCCLFLLSNPLRFLAEGLTGSPYYKVWVGRTMRSLSEKIYIFGTGFPCQLFLSEMGDEQALWPIKISSQPSWEKWRTPVFYAIYMTYNMLGSHTAIHIRLINHRCTVFFHVIDNVHNPILTNCKLTCCHSGHGQPARPYG